MNFLDSKLYRVMEVFTNFFLLNLLWLAACLPIVTIFPATAALFGVVREWVRRGQSGFFQPFVRYFKENFRQSLWIGLLWTLFGAFLTLDFFLLAGLGLIARIALLALFSLWAVAYLLASIYLFPVMVHYRIGWWPLIKNSLLIALSQPASTAKCLLVIAGAILLFFYLPITTLLLGSTTAYLIYHLSDRAFHRIEALKHPQ
ncbi:MAG: YesL family protein [Ardenticatenaceae bacterium]